MTTHSALYFNAKHPLHFVFLTIGLLMFLAPKLHAEPRSDLSHYTIQKGTLLVASDKMRDTNFAKSVIYVTEHGESGTFGLIINKQTYIPVNDAMPENKQVADPQAKIFFGGPVHAQHLFVLTKSKSEHRLHAVTDNVSFGAGDSIAIELNSDNRKTDTRTFMGFSNWTTTQLDDEIKNGQWLVVPGDDTEVFNTAPQDMWKKLYKRWSGNWI